MGMKVGIPLVFTGVTYSGTPVTDHPVANVNDVQHPLRTWRGAGGSIIGDLGAAKVIKAGYLNKANFPNVTWEVSSSATFASDVTALASGATVPKDNRVGDRRHAWEDFASNALSKQYVRITPSGSTDDGGPDELGAFAVMDVVTTLSDGLAPPLIWTPRQAKTVTDFPSGGQEVNVDGDIYLEWSFKNSIWVRRSADTILAELLSVLNAGAAATPIWYENRGSDKQHAYLVRRTDDTTFSEFFNTFDAAFTWRELI